MVSEGPCQKSNRSLTVKSLTIFSPARRESAEIGGFGESRRVDLFLPGPASLINHHAALDNGEGLT